MFARFLDPVPVSSNEHQERSFICTRVYRPVHSPRVSKRVSIDFDHSIIQLEERIIIDRYSYNEVDFKNISYVS